MHLLVIEDDPRLGRSLSRLLTDERHVVELAATGFEGLDLALGADGLDAVILDLGLPDIDGLEVCRTIRTEGLKLPVLILTARDAVRDRVAGLDAGADDYLVKPFAYPELSARLRALVRRGDADRAARVPLLRVGEVVLDETALQVRVRDEQLDLSQREFALLECLMRHPDQVLSRDQLLDHAWPLAVAVMPNTVGRIRQLRAPQAGAGGQPHPDRTRRRLSDGERVTAAPPRAETRMLRRTRLRLALWSGGTTLVVLLVLGVVVYGFVARQLAADSEEQLRARATLVAALKDPATDPAQVEALKLVSSAEKAGVLFGGPLSGTIAVVDRESGTKVDTFERKGEDAGKLDPAVTAKAKSDDEAERLEKAALSAAKAPPRSIDQVINETLAQTGLRADGSEVSLKEIDGVPTRIVSVPAGSASAAFVVHAFADRKHGGCNGRVQAVRGSDETEVRRSRSHAGQGRGRRHAIS